MDLLEEIEHIVDKLGYECVHVGLKNDTGKLKLQILIDMPGGINVNDCENVSKGVNKFLDGHDKNFAELDKGRYYLEVSSPGLERPLFKLSDYEKFKGREVRIRLAKMQDERKNYSGKILDVDENKNIILELENNLKKIIPFENIKGGNLIYRFEETKGAKSRRLKK